MSDIVSEVDLLYEQRANMRIPVTYAYTYVMKKMKGKKISELDDYVVWLRKTFNQEEIKK